MANCDIELDEAWKRLLARAEPRIARGLSRLARWASLRQIAPLAVDNSTIARFIAELHNATLVRKLRYLGKFVSRRWNELVAPNPTRGLRPVSLEGNGRALKRIPWESLSAPAEDVADRRICES